MSAPADPQILARRIWGRPGCVLLWSADCQGSSFLSCDPSDCSAALDPEPTLPWAGVESVGSAPDDRAGLSVPRWIGLLPYEAERSRLERQRFSVPEVRPSPLISERAWYRYPAVAVVAQDVTVVGDDLAAVERLAARLEQGADPGWTPARISRVAQSSQQAAADAEAHRNRVRAAQSLIGDGDVYQVNLARRLDFELEGDCLALLGQMSRSVKAPFALCWELDSGRGVVSTSPERFLSTNPWREVVTEPIKGTRPVDRTRFAQVIAELESDPKERAELSMVVDVERNDVGRVSQYGSVIAEVPRVIECSTVYHRVARVRGLVRSEVSRTELLEAMLPSGSVTGAPKVRAMELIAQLESTRRGLYTGALGYLSHDGCLNLGMAIRCLVRHGSLGHYHVGGGIVADSDPEREFEETYWKSEQVLS